jgi:hypothetical protein
MSAARCVSCQLEVSLSIVIERGDEESITSMSESV